MQLWPLWVALITLVFSTGGFYIYTKVRLSGLNNDLKNIEKSKAGAINRLSGELREERTKREKDLKEVHAKLENKLEGNRDQITDVGQVVVRMEALLKHVSASVERQSHTHAEIFKKIDAVKKDFVSTHQCDSLHRSLQDEIRQVAEHCNHKKGTG